MRWNSAIAAMALVLGGTAAAALAGSLPSASIANAVLWPTAKSPAALSDAATVFGAGQSDVFTDHPQQRGIGFNVDVVRTTIDVQLGHDFSSTGFRIV